MSQRKVSLSIGGLQRKYGDEEAIRFAKRIGCDAVDFDTCHPVYDYRKADSIFAKSDDEIITYYTNLKNIADSIGLEIGQTHGRIEGFTDDPEWNDAMVKNARLDFLVAKTLGAPVCVVHSVTTCRMGAECPSKTMHDLNFDMFCKYLDLAKQYGIKIATETFGDAPRKQCCDFFGNITEFLKSYNRVAAVGNNADYFVMCADTGHSNKATRFNNNPSPADAIRMMGSKIEVLHLNDNDTFTDQHKIPLTGCIDWNDVFDALDEIGYKGIYNMELVLSHFGAGFEKQTAEFAVKVMRNFLDTRYGK